MSDDVIPVSDSSALDATRTQTNVSGVLTQVKRERVVIGSDRTSATVSVEDALVVLCENANRQTRLLRGIYLQLAKLTGADVIEDEDLPFN